MKASHKLKLLALSRQGKAMFVGIQSEGSKGSGFGLYNVKLKGNPLDGSTVTGETIKKMGIKIKEIKR